MKKIISLILSVLICFSAVFAASAESDNIIYVSPAGSENPDGSEDAPFTLTQAKDYLRTAGGNGEYTVYLKGGRYELDETLIFTGEDRGNIVFESSENEPARICGSHLIDGWSETTLNGVRAFSAPANGEKITALFRSGEKLNTARYPEDGFFYVESTNDEENLWTEETTPNIQILGSHSFNGSKKDVTFVPSNLGDISAYIVHMWQEELTPVAAIDPGTGKVSLEKYASHTIEVGDRYFFDNVIEALDKSGEWCFDSVQDKIFYIPESGESVSDIELYGSSLTKLVSIDGCDGIGFRNVIFEETGWEYAADEYFTIPDFLSGYGVDIDVSQAGIDVCAAVTSIRSEDISFENCEFLNIGCTALKLMDESRNCSVESCLFNNIGGSGVFAGGQNNETECASDITVSNCEIGGYGQRFYRTPGIIFTFCKGAEIANNEIHNGNYTGISCGWVWLYGDHITQNINIENNLIYNIGQGMLSDMGGIYVLGTQRGSKIHGNVVHDVLSYQGSSGYAGTGIYTDAGSSEMEIFNNLVFNCSTAAFNATIGRNNVWYNNIAAYCGERIVCPPQNYMTFVSGGEYRGNIFLTDNKAPVYVCLAQSDYFSEHDNIVWDSTYGEKIYVTDSFSSDNGIPWKKALKKGRVSDSTVIADPLFTDAANYDFTLCEDSPAFDRGFKEWDYGEAGTKSGTVIGLSKAGGQTAYNSVDAQCVIKTPRLKFLVRLAEFFDELFGRIAAFFKKIFGVI